MSIARQLKRFFMSGLNRILSKAAKRGYKRFLVAWNRGLGDIPLGLFAFVNRVKQYIPEPEITFLTRPELEDAFQLLEGVSVIVAPSWKREDGTPTISGIKKTINIMGIDQKDFDVILNKVDPKGELKDCWGKLIPALKWKNNYDTLWKNFDIKCLSGKLIGVHIDTETQKFYAHKKDWPPENWQMLFKKLSENRDIKIILFGIRKTSSFDLPSVIDLRGKTSLLEMLSVIKNCCSILIAPDGGVLSITYYLNVNFPITVISLWGDPNQGILKQAVASPNIGLRHIPLTGRGNDISNITAEDVFNVIKSSSE